MSEESLGGKPTGEGFVCLTCGRYHPGPPMDFGVSVPHWYNTVPPDQRSVRCYLTSDVCVIDEKDFFVRGCLEIPVVDSPRDFVWGVWTSLSRQNFHRVIELWDYDGREREPPYFGWLSTAISLYPDTLNLKTHVHLRPANQRPLVELEPTDHPLAVEQRQGITMARVREIASTLLHEKNE